MDNQEKDHYFLVTVQINYNYHGNLGKNRMMNGLLRTKNRYIRQRELVIAQNQVTSRFNQEHNPDGRLTISDVTIVSFTHLGLMTEAEFGEGMEAFMGSQEDDS